MTLRVLLLAAVVCWGAPSTASAVTFGADLNSPPLSPMPTCAQLSMLVGAGATSCMYSYLGSSSTLSPPASGTVTRVRVRAGEVTGPMRVNVIRFLFQQTADPARPTSAGPFLQVYGPQFTPTPNAVTTVPVSLPVQVTTPPVPGDLTTIQAIDALALEVLDPNTQVPVFTSSGALTYPVVPGPSSQGLGAPSTNALRSFTVIGFGVLMNAELEPSGSGQLAPTPPTSPGSPAVAPTVRLPGAAARVREGRASVPVACQGADCAGTLALLSRGGAAATTSYGSARFTVKAGKTARVKVTLNRRGKALMRRRASAKVTARVTFSKGGGATQRFALTLKR